MQGSASWPGPLAARLLVTCVALCLPAHLAAASVTGYFLYPRDLERRGKNCSLPERVEVQLAIGRANLKLTLVKTGDLDPRAPIFGVLSSPGGGSVLQSLKLRTRRRHAAYQDSSRPAAVLLACAKTKHGVITMEGSVTYAGRVYRVRHADDSRARYRAAGQSPWQPIRLTPLHLGLPFSTDYKHANRNRGRTYYISNDREGSRDDTEGQAPPPRDQYHVDVLAVFDHAVFARYFSRSRRAAYATKVVDAVRKLVWNFALVFNEVNLRFRLMDTLPYKVNIRLIGYVISETSSSSGWLADEEGKNVSFRNADTTLEQFANWVAATDSLPYHDHAMLFSGYDLYRVHSGNVKKLHTTGLAYIGRACSLGGESVSIIEEIGGYMIDWTAAHELAHSLGARHDGDGNWCRSSDRYVMSTGEHRVTSRNQGNYWRFSPCSVESLHQFISETRRHAWGVVCLDQARPLGGEAGEDGVPRGQRLGPDQQCQQMYGPESRLLQRPLEGEAESVCPAMPCLDPQRSSGSHLYFKRHLAARGTSCGNKKWCINGECVYSTDAPVRLESCVFGEETGTAIYGRTCWDYVSRSPDVCYQPLVATRCCVSCAEVRTGIPGCDYGDRITCLRSKCHQGLTLQDGTPYDSSCCQTCHLGHTGTVPTSPTVEATNCTSSTKTRPDFAADKPVLDSSFVKGTSTNKARSDLKGTQQVPVTTRASTRAPARGRSRPDYVHKIAPAPTVQSQVPTKATSTNLSAHFSTSATQQPTQREDRCVDIPPSGGPACPILYHPETWHHCYDVTVATSCCSICRKLSNAAHPGCEFGDRQPLKCVLKARSAKSCRKLSASCCHTCSHLVGGLSGGHRKFRSTPQVLALAVVVALCL